MKTFVLIKKHWTKEKDGKYEGTAFKQHPNNMHFNLFKSNVLMLINPYKLKLSYNIKYDCFCNKKNKIKQNNKKKIENKKKIIAHF